ncbi:phage head closure protein [Raoultella ornithinolytica]|uniref:phage head closure protein n=1 Tax=Raoultella ornithinolytica TaxID=54291 RepID=UPI001F24344B|nr:phage head closure protein [Raoultella ornithinolytica]UIZ74512.1 phage head closure protein [Raoultella ornithinolytica]
MQVGKLRHRVIPQKFVSVQDPQTGEVTKNWVNLVQSTADNGIWAEVYPLSAREFTSAQATQNEITTRITIRRRADITAQCRILYRGNIYNIEGVLPDPRSGREYLTLPCSEGLNDD